MESAEFECDLLVIGGGMAGLSAGAWAASRGARVIIVEKARDIGGSAILSAGVLWTVSDMERMNRYGGGRPELAQVVLTNYPIALEWLRTRNIAMSAAMKVLYGHGYQIDIIGYLRSCVSIIEQSGGAIALETVTESLLKNAKDSVVGARTVHRDGAIDVKAKWTLLATGGYQGSPVLRERYIHANARNMRHRSNSTSIGDGLRLGTEVGGEVSGLNRCFYGHLVSETPSWGNPRLFATLTQYHSEFSILLNEAGQRFCDESLGDHTSANHTLKQTNARALCFWDHRVHVEHATRSVTATSTPVDKMEIALKNGGKGRICEFMAEIAAFADLHEFDGAQVLKSIEGYNERCRHHWECLSPPRVENFGTLDRPPFYLLIVHPAITFTYGGLSIDTNARVLKACKTPINGLLAAGSDAGDVFGLGYGGGLAMAIAYGIQAARTSGFGT